MRAHHVAMILLQFLTAPLFALHISVTLEPEMKGEQPDQNDVKPPVCDEDFLVILSLTALSRMSSRVPAHGTTA